MGPLPVTRPLPPVVSDPQISIKAGGVFCLELKNTLDLAGMACVVFLQTETL